MPTSGAFAEITAEFSSESLGSSENYSHYGIEAVKYIQDGAEPIICIKRRAVQAVVLSSRIGGLQTGPA